jgi:hypothetical protein
MDRPAVYVRNGFPPDDRSYHELKRFIMDQTAQKMCWNADRLLDPLPKEETTGAHSESHDQKTVVLKTPVRNLTARSLIGRNGNPSMVTEHFCKTPEDIEAYLSLPARKPSGSTARFFELREKTGGTGIVDCSLGYNPAGAAAALLGSETFAFMSVTRRELLHRLMRRRTEEILAVIDFAHKSGAGEFWSMAGEEYVVPPLHGPEDFDNFNARYDREIIERLRDCDHRMHIHCHGSVKKVISRFTEIGTAVLHPFEAPPSGDITPKEAKEAARGRMTLEGNLQISDMYNLTPAEIYEQTSCLIRDAFDDGRGLIICPSASPYIPGEGKVCLEQFKAMTEAAFKWSR